tara:strand:+ start:21069 stop:22289 length:1221 start_codon:yes stop_codon:yes gene_type:complete
MNKSDMKITVMGLGYIGLPTACILAEGGFNVEGFDVNQSVIDKINSGISHIIEPGIEDILTEAISSQKFCATSNLSASDIYFICVPTPIKDVNLEPDLTYVMSAASEISKVIEDESIIIVESTSPVGTTRKVQEYILNARKDLKKIYVGYCPERVLPGNIIYELKNNDRVIGGIDKAATEKIAYFYKDFIDGEILQTSAETAELCKLTENSFRDVNIAFANEISLICDKHKIDSMELISLANRHPRVSILQPGVGVGGHCIAVDPYFLVNGNKEITKLIQTSREVNSYKPKWVAQKIISSASKLDDQEIKIGLFGMSFKPNIDDLRESPSFIVAKEISKLNYSFVCVEPNVDKIDGYRLVSMEEALEECNLLVFLVAHDNFKQNDFLQRAKRREYLDFCGIVNDKE